MDRNKILDSALSKAHEILKKKASATAPLLPEEESLINLEANRPGLHTHDENNPLGLHRHEPDLPLDGPHVHTPQNPGGEHVHGEVAGMALVDGWHTHENGELGNHKHHEKDLGKNLNVVNPETDDTYQSGMTE